MSATTATDTTTATSTPSWGAWGDCTPRYSDDRTPVLAGDHIRYRQAPGGILPASPTMTAGIAVTPKNGGRPGELYLQAPNGVAYGIFGHIIERDADAQLTAWKIGGAL
jgi:hypothetical protein